MAERPAQIDPTRAGIAQVTKDCAWTDIGAPGSSLRHRNAFIGTVGAARDRFR